MKEIQFYGLESIPEVKEGDDLVQTISDACSREGIGLRPGDVVMITSKIVSKAEGRTANIGEVTPGRRARAIAKLTGKDAVEVELILRESESVGVVIPVRKIAERFPDVFGGLSDDAGVVKRLLDEVPAFLFTTSKDGTFASDAGLDYSNNPPGKCTLLPADPRRSASRIREGLSRLCGGDVAVIITDTEVSFTHLYGSTDIALGYAGIRPVSKLFGSSDRFGREKFGGADVVVDELAGASALLMGQTSEGVPVVIARNLKYEKNGQPQPSRSDRGVLSSGIRLSLLSTMKLRLAPLLEPFV